MFLSYIDFRSDTVTQPTPEMREAMSRALVGDDVYGDDPTVNELEEYASGLLGMEAALFVCSGTMGNLVSIMTHCARGEGVLMGTSAHTWKNEVGNVASIAGVMPFPLDDSCGLPTVGSIKESFQADSNIHSSPTVLLALENTHNAAGGLPIDAGPFNEVASFAKSLGLAVHLDGARIFNACSYFGVDVKKYTPYLDSVQFCLSKGLAAPMGSMVCGRGDFIARARKFRKALGGGQRQSGIAASAGLIALRDMRERLSVDHANASLLAELLQNAGLNVETVPARTNMVFFGTLEGQPDAQVLMELCKKKGLLMGAAGANRLRMVTHLDVSEDDVRRAADIIREVIKQ